MMSRHVLLICIFILLLLLDHCNPVVRYFTRKQTTCPWQWRWEQITPADEVTWMVAPTADYSITCTGFMTSDIPETKETPYTTHDDWLLLVAAVWTIVELTVPPPTQDAIDTTGPKALEPESNEAPQATSAVMGSNPEEDKPLVEGMTTKENKENCQAPLMSMRAICDFTGLTDARSCNNPAVLQTGLSSLSQCHQYDDNSQAFAEWKGSSQPSCPKWGPPPYLQGCPSRSSGPEAQNSPSGATASTERSRGQGPDVPPFN